MIHLTIATFASPLLLGTAEATSTTLRRQIEWHWPEPTWLFLVLVVVAIGLFHYVSRRETADRPRPVRWILFSLRVTILLLLVAMLARPVLKQSQLARPVLGILLDDSASMSLVDSYDAVIRKNWQPALESIGADRASRLNFAKGFLLGDQARRLKDWQRRYRLRWVLPSDPTKPVTLDGDTTAEKIRSLEADAKESPLGKAVETLLELPRGEKPAAIVVLSDGNTTTGPSLQKAAHAAENRDVALLCLGLGDPRPKVDLKLAELSVEPTAFVGEPVTFEAVVVAEGTDYPSVQADETVRVTLTRTDQPQNQKILAEKVIPLPKPDRPTPVRLTFHPERAGPARFTVEVAPHPRETDRENNRLSREVELRKTPIRVLLADESPRYEFRALKNFLSREPSVRLDTYLATADAELAEKDPRVLSVFPVRRETLFSYDVVILGDLDPRRLSRPTLDDLVEFVRRPSPAGALILVAGDRFLPEAYFNTPLAELMPIEPRSLEKSLRNIEPESLKKTLRNKKGSPQQKPFQIVPTPLGLGATPIKLGNSLEATKKIWAALPTLYWRLSGVEAKPAARIWATAIDSEKPLTENLVGSREAKNGPPVILFQNIEGGRVLMHLTDDTWRWRSRGGDQYYRHYWLGAIRFLSQAGRSQPASPAPSSEPDRSKTPTAVEFRRTAIDASALREAAEQTGGKFFDIETASQLDRHLPADTKIVQATLPPEPLWNRWPVLALLFGLLTVEWIFRRWLEIE